MAKDSSATTRQQTPHVNQTTRTATIIDALKQRAQAVLNDKSIDEQSRAIIRYGLETNDPWLAKLVRCADVGENIADTRDVSQTAETNNDDSTIENDSREKIEALAEIICAGGEEAAAALLVLMGKLQNSTDPKALAHTVKHFAFTRCGELNVNGMVDAQIEVVESELFAGNMHTS